MEEISTKESGIKVCIRARPTLKRENESSIFWEVESNAVRDVAKNELYEFGEVFDGSRTNEDVFNAIALPIVDKVMEGFDGTIFAYGQTSSGKTHTMMGNESFPGLIPLSVKRIFQRIKNIKQKHDCAITVKISYFEIYNETLRDLLNSEKAELKIRETIKGVFYVSNLKSVEVKCVESVMQLVEEGLKHRTTAQTKMNESSSRSHAVFQVTVDSRDLMSYTIDDPERKEEKNQLDIAAGTIAQLNMVDLAGSERASQTGTVGKQFTEGVNINKSLTTLTRVIQQIVTKQSHASFRDSKLTRILKSSLGGNQLTAIICNITLVSETETFSTLQFARNALQIKNKPKVNKVLTKDAIMQQNEREIRELKRTIVKLQKEKSERDNNQMQENELKDNLRKKIDIYNNNLLQQSSVDINKVEQDMRRMTWAPGNMQLKNTTQLRPSCEEDLENFQPGKQFFENCNETMPSASIHPDSDDDSARIVKKREKRKGISINPDFSAKRLKSSSSTLSAYEDHVLLTKFKVEEEKNTRLENQIKLYQKNVSDMAKEMNELNQKNDKLKETINQMKKQENPDIAAIKQAYNSNLVQLQDAMTNNRKTQQQCDELRKKNSILKSEVSGLTLEMSQIKAENDNKTLTKTMIVYEEEISKLKIELADNREQFNELKGRLDTASEGKSKINDSGSFFGGIHDVSTLKEPFLNTPVTKLKSPAKQQIESPAIRLKSIIDETIWNNKKLEIENLKNDLQSVMETLEFHEMEKFAIMEEQKTSRATIEEQKVLLANLNQQIEDKQLESKVKSCEQIELLESTIRTLKNQIKEQKLNFAEKFEPTNETEKKKISELLEVVERSEKNAVDAQSMFSDTNRKLSEMKTKKEDLELELKEQTEKLKLLEKDLDSYKAMCDFSSGMSSSRPPKMRRSVTTSSIESEMREADAVVIENLRQQVNDLKAQMKIQNEEKLHKAVRTTQTCIAQTDESVSVEQHQKLQFELLNMKEKQDKEIQPLVEAMKEKIKNLQEACEQSSKKQEEQKFTIIELNTETKNLKKELGVKDELINELNKQSSELEEKNDIMKIIETEKQELLECKNALENQLAENAKQLSLQSVENKNLNDKKRMLAETLAENCEIISSKADENNKLESKICLLSTELDNLKQQYKENVEKQNQLQYSLQLKENAETDLIIIKEQLQNQCAIIKELKSKQIEAVNAENLVKGKKDLEQKCFNLNENLLIMSNNKSQLEEKNVSLISELENLRRKYKEDQEKLRVVESSLATRKNETTEECGNLKLQNDMLKKNISSLNKQKSELENEIEKIKSEFHSKVESTEKILKEKDEVVSGFNAMQQELNSVSNLKISLEGKVVEIEKKLKKNQVELKNLKMENDNVLNMKSELQEINQNLCSNHNVEINTFKSQIESLQAQAAEEKQSLNSKLSELQREIVKLEGEKENQKFIDQNSQKLKLDEMAEANKLVEADKEELLSKLDKCNASLQSENKALVDQVSELKKIIVNNQFSNDELEKKLEIAESEKNQIEIDFQESLEKAENFITEESAKLRSLKESYEAKVQTLQIEMTRKYQENENCLKKEIVTLQKNNKKDNSELMEAKAQLQNQCNCLNENVSALSTNNELLKSENGQLLELKASLEKQLSETCEELSEFSDDNRSLKDKVSQLTTDLDSIKKQYNENVQKQLVLQSSLKSKENFEAELLEIKEQLQTKCAILDQFESKEDKAVNTEARLLKIKEDLEQKNKCLLDMSTNYDTLNIEKERVSKENINLQKELADNRDQFLSKSKKVEDLNEEIKLLLESKLITEEKLAEKEKKNSSQLTDFENLNKKNLTLSTELENLKQQYQKSQQKLREVENSFVLKENQTNKESENIKSQQENLLKEITNLTQQKSDFESEIKKLKNLLISKDKKTEELNKEKNNFLTELCTLKEKLNEVLKNKFSLEEKVKEQNILLKQIGSNEKLEEMKDEIDDLKLERRRRKMYVDGLEQEKDEAIENINKFKIEIAEVNAQLTEMKSKLVEAQNECNLLKEKAADDIKFAKHFKEDLNEQLKTCKEELGKSKRKLQDMTTDNNKLKREVCSLQLCEDPQFLQRKALLEENAENMTEFEKQFLLACDELKRWQEKTSYFENEVKQLEISFSDMQIELEETKKKLEVEVENKNSDKEKVTKLEEEKEKLVEKFNCVNNELDEYLSSNKELEAEKEKLQNQFKSLEIERSLLLQEVSSLTSQVKDVEKLKKNLQRRIESLEESLQSSELECEKLKKSAEAGKLSLADKKMIQQLTAERDAAIEEISAVNTKFEDYKQFATKSLEENYEIIQESSERERNNIKSWSDKYFKANEELEKQNYYLNESERKKEEYELKVKRLEKEIQSQRVLLDSALNEKQSRVGELTSKDKECVQLRIAIRDKNAEIERLNNQWKESQAKSEAQIFSFKENTQAEIREYQTKLADYEQIKQEHAQNKEKLGDMKLNLAETKSCNLKLQSDVEFMKDKLQKKETEFLNIKEELNTITSEVTNLQKEKVKLQCSKKQLESENKKLAESKQNEINEDTRTNKLRPSDYEMLREKRVSFAPSTSIAEKITKSQITPERREKMKKKIESTLALIADREKEFEEMSYDIEWRVLMYQEVMQLARRDVEIENICKKWHPKISKSAEVVDKSKKSVIKTYQKPPKTEVIQEQSGRVTRSSKQTSITIRTDLPCPESNVKHEVTWLQLTSKLLDEKYSCLYTELSSMIDIQNNNRRFRRDLLAYLKQHKNSQTLERFNEICDKAQESAAKTGIKINELKKCDKSLPSAVKANHQPKLSSLQEQAEQNTIQQQPKLTKELPPGTTDCKQQ